MRTPNRITAQQVERRRLAEFQRRRQSLKMIRKSAPVTTGIKKPKWVHPSLIQRKTKPVTSGKHDSDSEYSEGARYSSSEQIEDEVSSSNDEDSQSSQGSDQSSQSAGKGSKDKPSPIVKVEAVDIQEGQQDFQKVVLYKNSVQDVDQMIEQVKDLGCALQRLKHGLQTRYISINELRKLQIASTIARKSVNIREMSTQLERMQLSIEMDYERLQTYPFKR